MTRPPYPPTVWRSDAVSRDLLTAHACRITAVAAMVAGVWLAASRQWLAAALVLWLVPSLLAVGGLAHRAHARREGER